MSSGLYVRLRSKEVRRPRVRPKTFKTEELAKAYIKANGIKAEVVARGKKFILA